MLAVRNIFISIKNTNPLRMSTAFASTLPMPKEEKIKVGKYTINYVKVGQGPHNILCAPGALGSIWTDFKPQVDGIDREKFSLVVWDPPGFGKSMPPERDFSIDFYEKDADVAFQFMKELKIPKFSLLGWSDGGISSMILAAKYPDAVNKLVIWGANSFILPKELEGYKKIRDVNSWSKRMKEPMIELYGEERFATYWAKWVDTMEALFKAKDGNICSDLLENIKCQTLIVHGEKDPLVDGVHVSHLHTHIPGSRIHLYPEGKHNVHIRYADDFNKRVQEFLMLK
ncbi:valacyclovir hydrolase-like [Colias croceus]|uniref:valacyclovir hydrolase-like n=1 Tax=Colias crocea TaxID=72248 RepID=UPI001E27A075|nr:valacyclovir hydrolase-like [Colias croceus]